MSPTNEQRRRPGRWRIAVAGVTGWLLTVVAGLLTLTVYDTAPGTAAIAPASWPADSALRHGDGRSTLVLVLHPHCPCSSATVEELSGMLPVLVTRAWVHVLMVAPDGTSPGWSDGDLTERVATLPGVDLTIDAGGVDAARFGAVTSGQTYLFDASGTLRFSGGITPARAHQGDSVGRTAILAAVTSPAAADAPHASVYGCALTGTTPPPGLLDAWRNALHAMRQRWIGGTAA